MSEPSRAELVRRGETMNRLKDRQHALNMRLLLALKNHDQEAQRELTKQLGELEEQIRCLSSRTNR